jgi:hypothetical protein
MNMVVRVLLVYGVHGRAKFASVIGFGSHLNIGQQCERELWDTNDDTISSHSCRVRLHQLHVDADLLAKVKVVVNNLEQLLQHVIRGWLIGTANGQFHHFVLCELFNTFVVNAIGCPEDGIGDVTANQLGDGFDHTFFSANDRLIDYIQLVGFHLCLHSCGDGGEDGFAG